MYNKKDRLFLTKLILLIAILLVIVSFPNSVYAAGLQRIDKVTTNAYSDNWDKGLKLKTSTSSTDASSTGGASVKTGGDGIFYKLGISGYGIYEVRLTNKSQTATIRFNKIGTYNGTTVDCKATFKATNILDSSKSRLLISKNFYNGFLYYYLDVGVNYTFYKTGTKTKITIENTIFSVNSLNAGEGVKYSGSTTGYVSNDTVVTYENGYFHGKQDGGWTDKLGGANFSRATVSFKLKKSASHTLYYRASWGYDWEDKQDVWVAPSTIPVGTPKIPPTKKVSKTVAKKGDTITYTIKQKLHKAGKNYLDDHYTSLKIVDKLPTGLSFSSSSISTSNTKDGGKWKRTKSGQTITYTCKNPGTMKLTGQTITIKIVCKINDKALDSIQNQASTYINGFKFTSNKVTTTITPDPPVLSNSITKTGPQRITNLLDPVSYKISYSASVENFNGNAQISIVDMLPYEIDESKSNIDEGTYNKNNKSITWTVPINNISSKNAPYNKTINKSISVVFKNIDSSDGNMTNTVYGQIKTTTSPIAESERVESNVETEIPNTTDIVVTKYWEDSATYGKGRRPKNVQFVLVKNGEVTDIFSDKIDVSKDKFTFTFKNLPQFDANGKTITYDVMEVSKIAGEAPQTIGNSEIEQEEEYEEFEDESEPLTAEEIADETETEEEGNNDNPIPEGNNDSNPAEEEEGNNDEPIPEGNDESNPAAEEKTTNYIPYNLKSIKNTLIESRDDLMYYQDFVEKEDVKYVNGKIVRYINIRNKYTSINIKGNVWKDAVIDGKKLNESGFGGVVVQLFFETNNWNSNTKKYEYFGYSVRTDENGNYAFNDIPWNGKYKLRFIYNGQIYEATYYKNDLSGVYSNIKENETIRKQVNDRFAAISAYPNNYGGNKRAFGLNEKIKNADANDNNYNFSSENIPYTFEDILRIFDSVDYNINEYNDTFWKTFETNLRKAGINSNTIVKLREYINDSFMLAETPQTYSADNLKKLKPGSDNTIELITAGLAPRATNDLSIINDVYKVTSIINGKAEESSCNVKPELYEVSDRANNERFNGVYKRLLYKSDYLFDAATQLLDADEIAEIENNTQLTESEKLAKLEELKGDYRKRNLQVFITYRIKVKNNGNVSAKINSISDYYDAENLESVIDTVNSAVFRAYTFSGDSNFNKVADIGIQENGQAFGKYNKLTISGVDESGNSIPLRVYHQNTNSVDDILYPGEETDVYITFKAKNDAQTNRVALNKEIKNIAEINGYSTLYTESDDVIPDELGRNDIPIKKPVYSNTNAGLVDVDSDPGSLLAQDVDGNGNLIYYKVQGDKTYENMEDDTDKIGLMIQVSQDENYIRSIGGSVFEDERNVKDNELKTSIGNGYIEDNEKAINGVTVQLVELVREVDGNDGLATGEYKKEVVIGSYIYSNTESGGLVKTSDNTNDKDDKSYYSGYELSKVIESGTGELTVNPQNIGEKNHGQYRFDSIYPGDFYVRFIYGDTERTVLTNIKNEVNQKLVEAGAIRADEEGIAELVKTKENGTTETFKLLNAKSYNGQDYKSTIYQPGVDQSGSYNEIDGYQRYDTQNYSYVVNVRDKKSMYYYDLQKSNDTTINGNKVRVSDAKDIYDDRIKATLYSTSLTNTNAEVLDSFEKLGSTLSGTNEDIAKGQLELISNLIQSTQMRANTGVINISGNHNNATTSEIDLGLVERPKSQMSLSKEVANIKIVLANGQVLFNTNKSVNNLFFSKHSGHETGYDGYKITGTPSINRINGNETAELVQLYMDKELMTGASMEVKYKISAKNLGEVDYTDKKFYYTGIEDDPDAHISKTKTNKIVDYSTNSTSFEASKQDSEDNWKTVTADYLLENKLVSEKYDDEMKTYSTLIISEGLNAGLVPEIYSKNDSENSIELTVTTTLNSGNLGDTLVYNNTAEILETTNDYGRREVYSIHGNQEMTDQRLLANAIRGESREDRRIPTEIDADSSQKIVIMPPTGQRDYTLFIFTVNIGLGLVMAGAFIIKELMFKRKKNK